MKQSTESLAERAREAEQAARERARELAERWKGKIRSVVRPTQHSCRSQLILMLTQLSCLRLGKVNYAIKMGPACVFLRTDFAAAVTWNDSFINHNPGLIRASTFMHPLFAAAGKREGPHRPAGQGAAAAVPLR